MLLRNSLFLVVALFLLIKPAISSDENVYPPDAPNNLIPLKTKDEIKHLLNELDWEELKERFSQLDETVIDLLNEQGELSDYNDQLIRTYFREMADKRSSNETEWAYNLVTGLSTIISGTALLMHSPEEILHLVFLSYFVNQVTFLAVHIGYHANMIGQPINEMSHKTLFAFVHHYFDTSVFQNFWSAYRGLYFFEADENGIPNIGAFGNSSWVFPIFFATYAMFLDTWTALALSGGQLVWTNFQAITHEWYHTPTDRLRREHFMLPTYYLFKLCENIGFINTSEHRDHHDHGLDTLAEVKGFFDVHSFGFDDFGDQIFYRYVVGALEENDQGSHINGEKLIKRSNIGGVAMVSAAIVLTILYCQFFMFTLS